MGMGKPRKSSLTDLSSFTSSCPDDDSSASSSADNSNTNFIASLVAGNGTAIDLDVPPRRRGSWNALSATVSTASGFMFHGPPVGVGTGGGSSSTSGSGSGRSGREKILSSSGGVGGGGVGHYSSVAGIKEGKRKRRGSGTYSSGSKDSNMVSVSAICLL
jgi:hypothetical protein